MFDMTHPQAPDAARAEEFAGRVLTWFDRHGRKDLPWQRRRDPYRIWISEIMLQQTQVTTVIPYYQRFLEAFPDLGTLAGAPLDAVLHHWSGLGYYARARNLHRCAIFLEQEFDGVFPADQGVLESLPGIGRSTAGAIRSLAFGRRAAILDGNVKRVLARCFAVAGWPGESAVLNRLWTLSESLTPRRRCAAYNQAMMDLGSLVCTRGRPACLGCPLSEECLALAQGNPGAYPGAKPRKEKPVKAVRMVILRNGAGEILLEQRPPSGIWGGLWGLPEAPHRGDLNDWCLRHLGAGVSGERRLPERRHSFSHFHLRIEPVEVTLKNPGRRVMDSSAWVWYNPTKPDSLGVAAPVARILRELQALGSKEPARGRVKSKKS